MRLVIRVSALLLLCFTVLGGVIRLLAYDTAYFDDLREFVLPPNCPEVCFMGLIVGVTEFESAPVILRDHGWVRQVNPVDIQFEPYSVEWSWNGNQPAYASRLNVAYFDNRRLQSIQVPLDVSLAEMLAALGEPATGTASRFTVRLFYPDAGIVLTANGTCSTLLRQPVTVHYVTEDSPASAFNPARRIYRQVCGVAQ